MPPADHHDRVARATAWLDEHGAEQPDLAAPATEVGMSPRHLQRVFTRWPRARHVNDRSAGVEVVAPFLGPRAPNGQAQANVGLPLPVLWQGTSLQV